jgi:low temperature requirement protein LtrA
VFAITQVTARMAHDGSWAGIGRGLLVLAVIWWAWAAYAWLTNEVDASRRVVRLAVFAAMAAMLVAALAIPGAFEQDAALFAGAYLVVRLTHIGLFAEASEHVDVRLAARALAPTAVLAPALLFGAAALDGWPQALLWLVVIAIDQVGGAVRGIEGWHLSPGHFAERHGLIVIIALGESIVAIGVGAEDVELGPGPVTAAVVGVAVAATLWWTYFDDVPARVERRLHGLAGRERNTMARDAFSLLHLPMVAGIVLLALGVKEALPHVGDPLDVISAVALCGGVSVHLAGQAAYRHRCLGGSEHPRLLAAAACAVLIPLATSAPALVALAALALVGGLLVASEARAGARLLR